MVTQEYTFAYAAVTVASGTIDSLILPHVNTGCMQVFLDEIAARHPNERVIMVLDGAGWHHSQKLKLPPHLRLLFLPPYSPELNPAEHLWDELREKHFHNRVFDTRDALEDQLEHGLREMELHPERIQSLVAWTWIVDSLLNAK
jgi:transposase